MATAALEFGAEKERAGRAHDLAVGAAHGERQRHLERVESERDLVLGLGLGLESGLELGIGLGCGLRMKARVGVGLGLGLW